MPVNRGATPEARVYILVTDPNNFGRKRLLKFTSFEQVSSSLSVSGVGSATVIFRNKDMNFFQELRWPKWASAVSSEIYTLRDIIKEYKSLMNGDLYSKLITTAEEETLLYPWINPQDFIWIDYLGRDGLWYPGFTGIVTGYVDNQRAGSTASFGIQCKDLRRMLQYSPIVTSLNNISEDNRYETIITNNQEVSAELQNAFSENDPVVIFNRILETVNNIWNITGKDYKTFFKYKGDGSADEDLSLFGIAADRAVARAYSNNVADQAIYESRKANPTVTDYYTNPMGGAYYDKIFSDTGYIYQLLVRSQFSPYAIEMETALNILNTIAQATLSFIYVDQLGNLRYEYPRYGAFPSNSTTISDHGSDSNTAFHAKNYFLSSKDASFMSYKGGEDESQVVATRVVSQNRIHYAVNFDEVATTQILTGIDTASEADLLKYGLRTANIQPYITETLLPREALDAYAKAVRQHLNAQSRTFSIDLKQRPDLQLNRTFVFVDRMKVGLITDINDNFTPTGGHVRNITCKFARYVGEELEYPWKALLEETAQ